MCLLLNTLLCTNFETETESTFIVLKIYKFCWKLSGILLFYSAFLS